MNTTALFPRKCILNALGYMQNASRSSWSHNDGKRIFFDAWINRYTEDGSYPMCTPQAYPRPNKDGQVMVGGVTEMAHRGHVMWLAHLDLVLTGQREGILINPVPREAGPRQGEKGAKGWLPRYSTGLVFRDSDGVWFTPREIFILNLDEVVEWPTHRKQRVEDRRMSEFEGGGDAVAAAKALLKRHAAETNELLRRLE